MANKDSARKSSTSNASTSAAEQFRAALMKRAPRYGVRLESSAIESLTDYYALLSRWNKRLHLVAPSTPEEFATRHVLESLLALPHMATGARVIDIGSGGGLPIIPCLIAREDISARLFEASPKKTIFLREALDQLGLRERASVLDVRFEQRSTPPSDVVTCRALERFAEMLPSIYGWAPAPSRLLLFGGVAVRQRLEKSGQDYNSFLMPDSEQRYLFVLEKLARRIR